MRHLSRRSPRTRGAEPPTSRGEAFRNRSICRCSLPVAFRLFSRPVILILSRLYFRLSIIFLFSFPLFPIPNFLTLVSHPPNAPAGVVVPVSVARGLLLPSPDFLSHRALSRFSAYVRIHLFYPLVRFLALSLSVSPHSNPLIPSLEAGSAFSFYQIWYIAR